jgi:hypothetical protein
MRSGWRAAARVCLLLLAAVVCASTWRNAGRAQETFSHGVHLEAGLGCRDCHFVETKGPALPSQETCLTCHEAGKVAPIRPPATAAAGRDWSFAHQPHLDVGIECATCHGAGGGQEPRNEPSMQACVACHKETGVGTDCSVCHSTLARNVPPGPGASRLLDHTANWESRHGEISRLAGESCSYCHQQPDDCMACHSDTPPRGHTRLFKMSTHGTEAQVNRDGCTACHRTADFCQECHSSTKPSSHHPSWGNPGNQHCRSCHEPLVDTSCALCHKSLDAHLQTPPSDHVASWGEPLNQHCASCHLPLADTPCFTCHKDTESHLTPPSSHNAQFGQPNNQHCAGCHLPLADTECAVCHSGTPSHETEAPANTHTGSWGPPTSSHCGTCHVPLDPGDCGVCHRDADHSDAPPPPSHGSGWGEPANAHCKSCHLPLNSTECAICHTGTPSHHEPPSSHRGRWASRPYAHCNECHFPLEDQPCAVCHRAGEPDHSSAPDMPSWHNPRYHCPDCHVRTVHPLTHEACTQCHAAP